MRTQTCAIVMILATLTVPAWGQEAWQREAKGWIGPARVEVRLHLDFLRGEARLERGGRVLRGTYLGEGVFRFKGLRGLWVQVDQKEARASGRIRTALGRRVGSFLEIESPARRGLGPLRGSVADQIAQVSREERAHRERVFAVLDEFDRDLERKLVEVQRAYHRKNLDSRLDRVIDEFLRRRIRVLSYLMLKDKTDPREEHGKSKPSSNLEVAHEDFLARVDSIQTTNLAERAAVAAFRAKLTSAWEERKRLYLEGRHETLLAQTKPTKRAGVVGALGKARFEGGGGR